MKTESIDTSPKAPMAMPKALKVLIWIAIVAFLTALILPAVATGHSPVPLLIDCLVLTMAVGIPIWLARRRFEFMAVWLVIYCFVYGVLSWDGFYISENFGGNDNRDVWYPAYCEAVHRLPMGRHHYSLRPLGWFFLPLVLADRAVVHRTRFNAD